MEILFSWKRRDFRCMGLCLAFTWGVMIPSVQADEKMVMQAHELKYLSNSIGYHALLARYGNPNEIRLLRESRDKFDGILKDLSLTLEKNRNQITIQSSKVALSFLKMNWDIVRKNIDGVLNSQELLLALPVQIQKIRELTPRLLMLADETIEIGARENAGAGAMYLAGRQTMLSERIAKNIVLFGQALDADTAVALTQFGRDTKLFKQTLIRLRQEMPKTTSSKLDESRVLFEELENVASTILQNGGPLFLAQRSAQLVFEQGYMLKDLSEKLEDHIRNIEIPLPRPQKPKWKNDQRASFAMIDFS